MTVLPHQGKAAGTRRKGANFPWVHRVSLLALLSRLSRGKKAGEGSQTPGFIGNPLDSCPAYCSGVSDGEGLGWGLECAFQSSAGEADAAGSGSQLGSHCFKEFHPQPDEVQVT